MPAVDLVPHDLHLWAVLCVVFAPAIEIIMGDEDAGCQIRRSIDTEEEHANTVLPSNK
jgi:hypothetical protein